MNPFKSLGDLNQMRQQAVQIQKTLASKTYQVNEDGIRIVITGDQKIVEFEIQGNTNELVKEKLNKAIKLSQEEAAKELTSMAGGLQGLLGK